MDTNDLIGWASLAGFVLAFFLLYRFITAPRRRLIRLLGDGALVGLARLDVDGPDSSRLREFLAASLGAGAGAGAGAGGADVRLELGSAYRALDGAGYLFELVHSRKHARPGGSSRRYEHSTRFLLLEPTRLATPLVIRRRRDINVTGRLGLAVAERLGIDLLELEEGLLEAFRARFVVHAGGAAAAALPRGAQEACLREDRVWHGEGGPPWLDEGAQIALAPDFLAITLGRSPRDAAEVRGVIEFARRLHEEVSTS